MMPAPRHLKAPLVAVAALAFAAPALANNCDQIRAGIDAKVRAAGVAAFTLSVVDVAASAPGREVGRCGRGAKKILYVAEGKGAPAAPVATPPPAPAAPSKRSAAVLTECKDGTVTTGDCPKR